MKDDKNSDNRINKSNSVIRIKLRMAQSDPIKRRPLYNKHGEKQNVFRFGIL